MADEKETTSVPLSQAADAVDPEDPAKSPPHPNSPTACTRKVRIRLTLLPLPPAVRGAWVVVLPDSWI
jgi:hypothetical protein